MKKILLLTILLISIICVNAQMLWPILQVDSVTFEDTSKIHEYIKLDTNNGNIWRIGKPSKLLFDSAFSPKIAIVTNLNSYYSSNTHSSFILKFFSRFKAPYLLDTCIWFSGYYKIDSDSLKDYGIIEMSMDNGQNWINLDNYWYKGLEKPVFTGNLTDNWHYFLFWQNSYYASHSIDSLWFRFTFISDSIDNHKAGWIIDNINIKIITPFSIEDIEKSDKILVKPNPVLKNENFTISFNDIDASLLTIYNNNGKLIKQIFKPFSPLILDTDKYPTGLYQIRIFDKKGNSLNNKLIIY